MKIRRCAAALLFLLLMLATAEWTGEKEIIFPEMGALLIGAWVSDRQPWRVGRFQLLVLMTGGALAGVLIVRYLPLPLLGQIAVAFLLAASALLLSRTTLVPLLSAVILPVMLQTTSFIYPLSVCGMAGMTILIQWLMEKGGWRKTETPYTSSRPEVRDLVHWVTLFALVMLLSALPVQFGCLFMAAPPLIVMFTELSAPSCALRCRFPTVLLAMACASLFGAVCRLLLAEKAGLPLWLAAVPAIVGIFFLMHRLQLWFPPAGAAALLPMLLPAQGLVWYPLQMTVGACVFIGTALLLFRSADVKNPQEQPI